MSALVPGSRQLRAFLCLAAVACSPIVPRAIGPSLARSESPKTEAEESRLLAELRKAHNDERAKAGLPPLSASRRLERAARDHAGDLARHKTMSHEGSDHSSPLQRIERRGDRFRAIGENVARGQPDVRDVMRSWMNSPEHKKNILGDFTEMGGAAASDDEGRRYWCVDFGRSWPVLDATKAGTDFLAALNRARSDARKPPLAIDPILESVARRHARDLAEADQLAAKDRDGLSPLDRASKLGYRFTRLAEESSSGDPDPASIVRSWRDRPEHSRQLLGDFTQVGIGYAASKKGRPYWCVVLGQPSP